MLGLTRRMTWHEGEWGFGRYSSCVSHSTNVWGTPSRKSVLSLWYRDTIGRCANDSTNAIRSSQLTAKRTLPLATIARLSCLPWVLCRTRMHSHFDTVAFFGSFARKVCLSYARQHEQPTTPSTPSRMKATILDHRLSFQKVVYMSDPGTYDNETPPTSK